MKPNKPPSLKANVLSKRKKEKATRERFWGLKTKKKRKEENETKQMLRSPLQGFKAPFEAFEGFEKENEGDFEGFEGEKGFEAGDLHEGGGFSDEGASSSASKPSKPSKLSKGEGQRGGSEARRSCLEHLARKADGGALGAPQRLQRPLQRYLAGQRRAHTSVG